MDLSVEESIPSAYTSMVAYEVKSDPKEAKDEEKKAKKGKSNGKYIAAAAVGGIVVLGAAAFVFGDVGTCFCCRPFVFVLIVLVRVTGKTLANVGIPGDLGIHHMFNALSNCPCDCGVHRSLLVFCSVRSSVSMVYGGPGACGICKDIGSCLCGVCGGCGIFRVRRLHSA